MHDNRHFADSEIGRSKILIVDDNPTNVQIVTRMLDWAGFANISYTYDSLEAMTLVKRLQPDLVIVDIHMPGLNGIELTRMIRHATEPEFIPILIFTADHTKEAKSDALAAGATDFLTKPGESQEILLRVRNFLQMRRLYRGLDDRNKSLEEIIQTRTAELEASNHELVERFARAAELYDADAGRHTIRVGQLSADIAEALHMSDHEVALLRQAAPLHDIGKIGIPEKLWNKPTSLTPEEAELVHEHVRIGLEILEGGHTPVIRMAQRIIAGHHEHFDGSGYPNGLSGTDIPLAARIVAVADAYDAMTHCRSYRPASTAEAALHRLWQSAGTQFDPKIVEALEFQVRAELSADVSSVIPAA